LARFAHANPFRFWLGLGLRLAGLRHAGGTPGLCGWERPCCSCCYCIPRTRPVRSRAAVQDGVALAAELGIEGWRLEID
jgi:hypothetical protein